MLACADIEEGIVLRDAGVQAPILVFGALSVSDLGRDLLASADAHDLDTMGGACAAGRGSEAQRAAALSSQDRYGMNRLGFRHDNLARTMPEGGGEREPADRRGVYALCDRRQSGAPGLWRTAGALRGCSRGSAVARRTGEGAACGQRRRAAGGTSGCGSTTSVPACCCHGVVPPPLHATLDAATCPVTHEPYRCGEGTSTRRGNRLRTQDVRWIFNRPRSQLFQPDTPTASTSGSPAAARCSSAAGDAPIVGSVCMDVSMIDVTGMDISPGDEVVIIGDQGDESMGVREMAAAIGAIPAEGLCSVGSRIQRVYE